MLNGGRSFALVCIHPDITLPVLQLPLIINHFTLFLKFYFIAFQGIYNIMQLNFDVHRDVDHG